MSAERQFQPSDELISMLRHVPAGKNLNDRIRISIAIGLFSGKKASLSRSAYLAGVSLVSFMEILRDYGIPCIEYTQEDLDMDMKTIKYLEQCDNEEEGEAAK